MKRPFSDEDIEKLKATPYVPPEPLTIPAILLLILFFPYGIYYLCRKNTPEYLLSRCKTEKEREALFAYLKTPPLPKEIYINNSSLRRRKYPPVHKPFKDPFADNLYRIGTAEYKAAHGIRL